MGVVYVMAIRHVNLLSVSCDNGLRKGTFYINFQSINWIELNCQFYVKIDILVSVTI